MSSVGRYSVIFNTSLTLSPGNYTYRIIANDSSNNLNDSVTSTFVVNDITPPSVTSAVSNINVGNQTNRFNLSANVSDNFILDTVLVNVSNSTNVVVSTLVGITSGGSQFSVVFNTSDASSPGVYSFRFIANDSSNNLNSSVSSTFTVSDVVRPNVTDPRPVAGAVAVSGASVEVSVNVSDNFLVGTVLANVTDPSGTTTAVTLALAVGSKYNGSYAVGGEIGRYNVSFRVNDSSNNVNGSVTTFFTVADTRQPNVSALRAVPGVGNQSNSFNLSANVSDNFLLDSVLVNVSNSTNIVVSTLIGTLSSVGRYSVISNSSLSTSPGNYSYRIIANDSTNNLNDSVTSTFVVDDVTPPSVTSAVSHINVGNQTNRFNLSANVSDNFILDTVRVNISNSTNVVVSTLIGITSGGSQLSVVSGRIDHRIPAWSA